MVLDHYDHVRRVIFVQPFVRGMFSGLKDASLKLVIWCSYLSDGLSCLMLKYSFKITKHHVYVRFCIEESLLNTPENFLKPAAPRRGRRFWGERRDSCGSHFRAKSVLKKHQELSSSCPHVHHRACTALQLVR